MEVVIRSLAKGQVDEIKHYLGKDTIIDISESESCDCLDVILDNAIILKTHFNGITLDKGGKKYILNSYSFWRIEIV